MTKSSGNRLNVSVIGTLVVTVLLGAPAPDSPVADSPVADAAQRGDLAAVRSLLRDGADVNAAQGDGMTALHWAALNGDIGIVEVVLYAGAHLEATTRLGSYTPLHLASKNGRVEAVRSLLAAGAKANAITGTGVSPLHFAAASGQTGAVRALIEFGGDVDHRDEVSGRTPLMFATGLDRLSAVDLLIESEADVSIMSEVVDYAERGEADSAERSARSKLVAARREAARGGLSTPPADPPNPPATGRQAVAATPVAQPAVTDDPDDEAAKKLAAAARGEDEEKAEEEEDKKKDEEEDQAANLATRPTGTASTNTPRPLSYNDLVGRQGGLSALHYAARDGRAEIATRLLAAGADLNQPSGGDRTTPLLMAVINGNYDLAMYFLQIGADPNLASDDGAAPLYATLNNRWAPKALYPQPTAFKQQKTSYLELMEEMLERGADPNARLETHIWYASYNFDLLGVNFQGATPFWRAAYATDVGAMKLLVRHGADPALPTTKAPSRRRRSSDAEDPSGLPPVPIGGPAVHPIHAASGVGYGTSRAGNSHRHAPKGWLPAVKYLVEELEADVNARDHDGYSAVHHAAARGDNELIRYLVEKGADVTFVSRRGQTTVDMANGPQQRVQPFPETIALLEGFGAKNNHNCLSC